MVLTTPTIVPPHATPRQQTLWGECKSPDWDIFPPITNSRLRCSSTDVARPKGRPERLLPDLRGRPTSDIPGVPVSGPLVAKRSWLTARNFLRSDNRDGACRRHPETRAAIAPGTAVEPAEPGLQRDGAAGRTGGTGVMPKLRMAQKRDSPQTPVHAVNRRGRFRRPHRCRRTGTAAPESGDQNLTFYDIWRLQTPTSLSVAGTEQGVNGRVWCAI